MTSSGKKRRKAFLNDLCVKFGIDNPTDPRRSDAAIAFIAFGESQCRAWLAQAQENYIAWSRFVDIKKARKIVSNRRTSNKQMRQKRLQVSTPTRKKKRTRNSRTSAHKVYFRYTVGADGAVTTWKHPNRSNKYTLDRI